MSVLWCLTLASAGCAGARYVDAWTPASSDVPGVLLFVYISALFCFVAVIGRPPNRLFPIGALSWPLSAFANRPVLRIWRELSGARRRPRRE